MIRLLNHATGKRVEMIYISKDGQLSQRIIKVIGVTESSLKAYCYTRRQFRTFCLANILSVSPVRKRRGA